MTPELHRPWFSHYEPSVPRTVTVFDQPLYSLLDEAAARYPKRPALIFQNTRLSYKALHEAAERFAGALRRAGIRSVETLDEVKPGETVMIRSHGVTPDVYRQCEARGIPVIDATCPHVAHIHQLVRQYSEHGDTVVIVGEADHPEVVGIAGWARGRVFILPDAQAAEQAELPRKALVVAQTTIRRDRFDSVLQVLRRRVPDLTERITICTATSQRQQEAEKLSGEADVMVVVGGRNSSNTQKLLETCRLRCERSVLVETPEDVPPDLAKADDRVALTAGASTPQWLLEQVRARIEENAKTR